MKIKIEIETQSFWTSQLKLENQNWKNTVTGGDETDPQDNILAL